MLKNVKPLFVPFFLDHIPFLSLVPGMVSPSWASSEPRNSWSPSRIWRVPLESVERWQQESVDEVCEETLDAACSELAGIGVQNVPWIFVTSFLAILIGGFWKIFCPRRVYCCGRLGIPRGWGRVGPWRPRSVAEVTACCFHVTGECCWMEPGKKLPQGYKSDDICLSVCIDIYIYMCVCVHA